MAGAAPSFRARILSAFLCLSMISNFICVLNPNFSIRSTCYVSAQSSGSSLVYPGSTNSVATSTAAPNPVGAGSLQ